METTLKPRSEAYKEIEALYGALTRHIAVSGLSPCPVDFIASYLRMCQTQSCGKCTPCRVGLGVLADLIDRVLDGDGTPETIDLIERTARDIHATADCAIGYTPANTAYEVVRAFRDDFEHHLATGTCGYQFLKTAPCVTGCPAHVNIPGYIALEREGRCTDAVRLIRMDNPLVVSCCMVCEHPCEDVCRRGMVDDPINIRALKRYAVEGAGDIPLPEKAAPTGKKIAVVGGGPAGLTAAYYLALFGHSVTIYEQRHKLGGMLRYGIPNYRLPKDDVLDGEINWLLSAGIDVECDVSIGRDIPFEQLKADHDAVFIGIGAHAGKSLRIPGEDAEGVISAVELLRAIGDGARPDFAGKRVVVVGGGNVAMDAVRSSVRLGAESVTMVYRRRVQDMTASAGEIQGAREEGIEIMQLYAPDSVEVDGDGHVAALLAKQQIIGAIVDGRAKPYAADRDPVRIPADVLIVAIGQDIEAAPFEEAGLPVRRNKTFVADRHGGAFADGGKVFAGGDCVFGPVTVIKGVAAGKEAATEIDRYLGFDHQLKRDIEMPLVRFDSRKSCARSITTERPAEQRKRDFEDIEVGFTREVAEQEASRCLRCDHFGFGALCERRMA